MTPHSCTAGLQTKPNLSFSSNLAGRTTREVMKGLMCPISCVCGHFGTFSITWNLFFSVSQSIRGKHSVTVTVCPDCVVPGPVYNFNNKPIWVCVCCVPTDGMFNSVHRCMTSQVAAILEITRYSDKNQDCITISEACVVFVVNKEQDRNPKWQSLLSTASFYFCSAIGEVKCMQQTFPP